MCQFFKFLKKLKTKPNKTAQPLPTPPPTPPIPAAVTTGVHLPKIPLNPAFMEILNKVGSAFKKAIALKENMDTKNLTETMPKPENGAENGTENTEEGQKANDEDTDPPK